MLQSVCVVQWKRVEFLRKRTRNNIVGDGNSVLLHLIHPVGDPEEGPGQGEEIISPLWPGSPPVRVNPHSIVKMGIWASMPELHIPQLTMLSRSWSKSYNLIFFIIMCAWDQKYRLTIFGGKLTFQQPRHPPGCISTAFTHPQISSLETDIDDTMVSMLVAENASHIESDDVVNVQMLKQKCLGFVFFLGCPGCRWSILKRVLVLLFLLLNNR